MIGLKQLGNSIATQLLRTVFALYCVVAIIVTALQVVAEYKHTETMVKAELIKVEEMYTSVLSASVWNLDYEQIQNSLRGMYAMPVITGVKISQRSQVLSAIGEVVTSDDRVMRYSNEGELITDQRLQGAKPLTYSFPIIYFFRGKERHVGYATVYANSRVVFNRVKIGIVLLIINAIFKTIALWVIFFYVSKYMLVRPLERLLGFIKRTDFNAIQNEPLDLKLVRTNEFTEIESAFRDMIEKLVDARQALLALNNGLEHQVAQRTADLSVAKAQAEQLSADKVNFMSRISHELNTPLSAIMEGAKVLSVHSDSWSEEDKYLSEHVLVASQHLSMLVNDIICNLQMQKGDFSILLSPCDLQSVVETSVAMLAPLAQDKKVDISYDSLPFTVLGDEGRLRQVLLNIISNAIVYNHENGKVTISASDTEDDRVALVIEDTGIGMIDADLARIFKPFERLDYAKQQCIEGMGIGLTIVSELLKYLDAEYRVSSQLGKGTRFTVLLKKQTD